MTEATVANSRPSPWRATYYGWRRSNGPRVQRNRMRLAVLGSVIVHILLLLLVFDGEEYGLPGFGTSQQERRVEAPDLRVVLTPQPVAAAEAVQQEPTDDIAAVAPAPEAAVTLAEARPQAAAVLKAEAITSATLDKPLPREAPPAATAPPMLPAAPVIAMAPTEKPKWVVPPTPAPPTPAVAMAPSASSPDTSLQEVQAQETARREAAREEAQRQEEARQAAARQEAAKQEAARQEAARQEASRQLLARQDTERKEAARQEAARAEAARVDAERQDAARMAAARQDALRQEAARAEAARQEVARQEIARQEAAAKQEAARQEAARQVAARQEAARLDAVRQEGIRQEAIRAEAARLEAGRQAAARQEAGRIETGRQEAAREAEAREERKRAIGRQLNEEAAKRDAAAPKSSSSALPLSYSSARRGRLFGRIDTNAELVLYGEAWARKIQLNQTFEMAREAIQQPHTDPLVTVAIRADGSVESITFVRSSGVSAVDDAVRRIITSQERYETFPPALAREYDVVEIRRTWHFDSAIRLY